MEVYCSKKPKAIDIACGINLTITNVMELRWSYTQTVIYQNKIYLGDFKIKLFWYQKKSFI